MTDTVWKLHPTNETLWRPTVPLMVVLAVRETKRPQLLSVWLGLRWLCAFAPQAIGWTGRDIARAALMPATAIQQDLDVLDGRTLIVRCATKPRHERRYTMDTALLARLETESLTAFPAVLRDLRGTPQAPE